MVPPLPPSTAAGPKRATALGMHDGPGADGVKEHSIMATPGGNYRKEVALLATPSSPHHLGHGPGILRASSGHPQGILRARSGHAWGTVRARFREAPKTTTICPT